MKSEQIWKILDIEPTHSKKEIRKAYAAQAKLHHLEEEPEAFAQLKEAYQKALEYAEEMMPASEQKMAAERNAMPEMRHLPEEALAEEENTKLEEFEKNKYSSEKYKLSAVEILRVLGYTQPQTPEALRMAEEFEKQHHCKVPDCLKEYIQLAMDNPLLRTADIWSGGQKPFWGFLYDEIEEMNEEEEDGYPGFFALPREKWKEKTADYLEIGSDYAAGVVTFGIRMDDIGKENPPVYMHHEANDIIQWEPLWETLSDYLLTVTCDALLGSAYRTAQKELENRNWKYDTYTKTDDVQKLLSEHRIRISDLHKIPSLYTANLESEYISCCYSKEEETLYLIKAAGEQLEVSVLTKETVSKAEEKPILSKQSSMKGQKTQPSLLDRLEQEEERRAEESLKQGALHDLIEILEDSKRRNKAKVWQEYFLSESFLKEQQEEPFIKGVNRYLESCWDSIPGCFWTEFAIAYGRYEEIKGNAKALYRPENVVRLRAFSDYLMLKRMNQQGYLTEKERTIWEKMLCGGKSNNLYERNGAGCILDETRSECVIILYTHWLRSEQVPLCICSYMYKEYDLKNIEHSSVRRLYADLKDAVLQQYPAIEEELFGADSRTQMIGRWYREMLKLILDYYSCYDRRTYEEPETVRERAAALLERNEWKQLKHDRELFDKIYQQLANRKVIPVSLAQRLYDFYLTEGAGYQEEEKVQELLEGLIQAIRFNRRLEEKDYRREYPYQNYAVTDIGERNERFWEYFLMTGFGYRYTTVIGASQKKADYIRENKQYLPGYIRAVYMPSMEWCKLFTNFDEEENTVLNPVSTAFFLPDGREIRLEYHLHYVRYFLDGQPVIEPVLSFEELQTYMGKIQKTEEFFFMLAVTAIEKGEQPAAKELIELWLKKLPLYAATVPFLAEALASDNARSEAPENELKRVQAVFYSEQERFCFKTEVSMRGVKLYKQTDFGWEELTLLSGEGKRAKTSDIEGKKEFAEWKVKQMMQPKPVKIKSFSLEGMSNEEKMAQIIEALKQKEKNCKWEKRRGVPYTPGFPWSQEEITDSVRKFFAEDGGWMTESFVVLHMGTQKKRCFERIFYSVMNIFGFDLSLQSQSYVGSCNAAKDELRRKIKEKHLIVGRFGWGNPYEAYSAFAPVPFAVGESGTFYACGPMKLYRENTLAALMAKLFDFSDVTQADIYNGRLTVSRFDHMLEYCYTDEDFQNYLNSKSKTLPDMFTKFGI